MTDLRITVKNTSDTGGTFLTPVWFGLHNGSFNLFDVGGKTSPGLEAIAEDGNNGPIANELIAADPNARGGAIAGAAGPISTQEVASTIVRAVDGSATNTFSFASMLLPSNDAFIGSEAEVKLFDATGRFNGEQTLSLSGRDVYDAGTEINTELDAAFINQSAPNTGVDENGVIRQHPGFNGSLGNPVGEGAQIVLGGTNAAGAFIDPVAADFTQPGAQIAVVHVNTVVERNGTARRDFIYGGKDDDIVNAAGGNDIIISKGGWDVIDAGAGIDFVLAGSGDDVVNGADGNDGLHGQAGDDSLDGGSGRDYIKGGAGEDLIDGGLANDVLFGGGGNDTFVFAKGDGRDTIKDFGTNAWRGDDRIALDIDGVDSFTDVLAAARSLTYSTVLDFGGGDKIVLHGVKTAQLQADDFLFA